MRLRSLFHESQVQIELQLIFFRDLEYSLNAVIRFDEVTEIHVVLQYGMEENIILYLHLKSS